MSTKNKPQNIVEKSTATAVAETKPAAAAKKASARTKKISVKAATTGFASRRVWPD